MFKIFVDKKKVAEVIGWDAYFDTMEKVAADHPGLYDPDKIFSEMEFPPRRNIPQFLIFP